MLITYRGIIVPGGFGHRGTEGMVAAVRWAREQKVPFLGICLGFQVAVIEWARSVCNLQGMCGPLLACRLDQLRKSRRKLCRACSGFTAPRHLLHAGDLEDAFGRDDATRSPADDLRAEDGGEQAAAAVWEERGGVGTTSAPVRGGADVRREAGGAGRVAVRGEGRAGGEDADARAGWCVATTFLPPLDLASSD